MATATRPKSFHIDRVNMRHSECVAAIACNVESCNGSAVNELSSSSPLIIKPSGLGRLMRKPLSFHEIGLDIAVIHGTECPIPLIRLTFMLVVVVFAKLCYGRL